MKEVNPVLETQIKEKKRKIRNNVIGMSLGVLGGAALIALGHWGLNGDINTIISTTIEKAWHDASWSFSSSTPLQEWIPGIVNNIRADETLEVIGGFIGGESLGIGAGNIRRNRESIQALRATQG